MKIFKKAKRGFTLVELVVVIAVIAILAAVSVGAYFGITESANKSRLEQETKQMHTAIQTVALGNNSNAQLTADGLTVKSINTFEEDLEKSYGSDITVYADAAPVIGNTPTVVLKKTELQKAATNDVYKTYEYYQPEIRGKKVITDVVTGDTKIDKSTVANDPSAEAGEYVKIFLKNTYKEWGADAYVYTYSKEGDKTSVDNIWPGDRAEIVSLVDDIYSVEVNTAYQYIVFSNGIGEGNEGHEQIHLDMPSAEDLIENPYYDGSTWIAEPEIEPNASITGLTAYFRNSLWENISIYTYNLAGEYNEAWPGEKMEIYDSNRVDNLSKYTFTDDYYRVIFNNGDKENDIVSTAQTSEIPFNGFDATNCYWDGEMWTTLPEDFSTEPTYRTIYVKEPSWWHNEGFVSYVYQYHIDSNNEEISINNGNSSLGVEMTHVLWDGDKYINYRSFTFETTMDVVDGFRIYRVSNGYNDACSVDVLLDDLGENNLVILDNVETKYDEETEHKTSVTYGNYETDKETQVNGIYFRGNVNNWLDEGLDENYMLNRGEDGVYFLSNIELTVGDEFKVWNSNNNNWYGHNSELNAEYVDTTVEDTNNIKMSNHGIYTIKLTLGGESKISIEQTEDLEEPHVCSFDSETGDCTCGEHQHVFNPNTGICNGANCDEIDPNWSAEETSMFKKNTIFFDNSNKQWSKVNIYYWGNGVSNEWPGVAMQKIENTNIYYFEFSDNTPANIIFNDGNTQTADLEYPTSNSSIIHNGNNWIQFCVTGTFNSWNNNDEETTLSFNEKTGVFSYTRDLTLEDQFKVCYMNSRDNAFNYDSLENKEGLKSLDGNNKNIGVETPGLYTIELNYFTKKPTLLKIIKSDK